MNTDIDFLTTEDTESTEGVSSEGKESVGRRA